MQVTTENNARPLLWVSKLLGTSLFIILLLLSLRSQAMPPWSGIGAPGHGSGTGPLSESVSSNGNIILSDIPLETGLTPPPDVLLIADDSGSMDWEVVVGQEAATKDESLETVWDGSTQVMRYAYVFGGPINFFGRIIEPTRNVYAYTESDPNYFDLRTHPVVPLYEKVASLNLSGYSAAHQRQILGLWRLRNYNYNLIFYNPNYTYEPWPGFSNSNPRAAREDPQESFTVDLTNSISTNSAWHYPEPDNSIASGQGNSYMPTYYVWDDANGNKLVDYNECAARIEIKSNARRTECDGSSAGAYVFPMPKPAGRTDCAAETSCTYDEEIQNFANWFTYYRRREYVAKAALARVVTDVMPTIDGIKLGFATINAHKNRKGIYSSGRPLVSVAKNSVEDLRTKIYSFDSGAGTTPLMTALDRSGKYFSCSSADNIFRDVDRGYGSSTCPRQLNSVDDPKYQSCQQNYTVLMTDGFWTSESYIWEEDGTIKTTETAIAQNHDADSTSPFDGGAFADDNMSHGSGNNWPTLADIAMYYYKNDLAPGVSDGVRPTYIDKTRIVNPNYWDSRDSMHQHMKTFTVGLGVFDINSDSSIGGIDPFGNWMMPQPTDTVNWPRIYPDRAGNIDSSKLDDLKHAAYNGRGMYYQGNNAEMLSNSLRNVFKAIAQGAGAVGAVSFNSQQVSNGSVVYTASYNSQTNSGDVVAYNIDETTGQVLTDSANTRWRAATQLASKVTRSCTSPGDSRNILTYKRDGSNSQGVSFTAANTGLLEREVKWLRGQSQDEADSACSGSFGYRSRNSADLLGDIVHSRPLYVGDPDGERYGNTYPSGSKAFKDYVAGYKTSSRTAMVYVGANDGFLHALDASSGAEKFAYLPQRLIDGGDGNNSVKDLLDPSYSHKYFVDLSPSVEDVFIKTKSDTTRDWRTVVMGGYGNGGRGYFALDVSNPDIFTTQGSGANKVMWEFSDLDDDRLGTSYSQPLMALSNTAHTAADNGNRWVALFGNGYNSKDGKAGLFVLDLEGAADGVWSASDYKFIEASASPSSGLTKNGLGVARGIDKDDNGTVDYAYAGDLYGNLYRFDLSSSSGDYSVTKIFEASDGSGKKQSITAQPTILPHPEDPNSVIVMVATGSWMTRQDAESTDIQSLYGIMDTPGESSTTTKSRTDLAVRHLVNVASGSVTQRVIRGEAINWTRQNGWYLDFAARASGVSPDDSNYATAAVVKPGERAIRNTVSRGGYTFFNTVYPNQANGCDPVYGGSIMALNPKTGLVDKAIMDLDNDGEYDSNSTENVAGVVTDTNLSNSAMHGNRLVVQQTSSTGTIVQSSIKTNTDPILRTGRLSWNQLQ